MMMPPPAAGPPLELYDPYGAAVAAAAGPAAAAPSMHIMPSMSSLEALLSKLPSVVPAPQAQPPAGGAAVPGVALPPANKEVEEEQDDYAQCHGMDVVASSGGESLRCARRRPPSGRTCSASSCRRASSRRWPWPLLSFCGPDERILNMARG